MYAILRTKKLKSRSQITQASEHNLRIRVHRNIDSSRSNQNTILHDPLHIDTADATSFQARLSKYYSDLGIKEKKNNTLAFEYVATASPEFFANKEPDAVKIWAADQTKFMLKEFGSRLKFGILHLDEKTPHIHFFVSTELKSVKKYKNQKGEFHKETWSLNSEGIDPDYLRGLQTRYALENKKWGLRRGVVGSKRTNLPLKKFYAMVDNVMQTSYKAKIDEMIDRIELSIGERLSIETIRNKIREHLTPYINGMTKQQKAIKEVLKLDLHKLQTELIKQQAEVAQEREEISRRREVYSDAINSRTAPITIESQRILRAERARLDSEKEGLAQLREIYNEAINQRLLDIQANEILMGQNMLLAREVEELKHKNTHRSV